MRTAAISATASLLILTACQTTQPEYSVPAINTARLSKADAQNLIIQNTLASQLRVPIDQPLRALNVDLPKYPESLWRDLVEGVVLVRFTIDQYGAVVDSEVVGAAVPTLASLAVESLRKWRFEPITRDGKPIRLTLTFEFQFRLE